MKIIHPEKHFILFLASLAESVTDQTVEVDTSGNKDEPESNTAEESSPEKIQQPKQRKKTKEELKAELKEQKVMERRSRRQRIRNKRYNRDIFIMFFGRCKSSSQD